MDLGYGDNGELDAGEASMLDSLPSKSGAISSGIIASICLCDGKSTKPLFNYISSHKNVTLTFSSEGLEIVEVMVDSNTKAISYVDIVRFKASKQLSYCYCPQNIDGDGDKTSISLTLETQSLVESVSNNKVGSSVIFEYNRERKTDLSVTVINNGRPDTSFKSVVISRPNTNPLTGNLIVDRKDGGVEFGFGIISDTFSSIMAANSKKHKNVCYGSTLEVFKNGLKIHSKIPKVKAYECGQSTGDSIKFELSNETTSRFGKLVKISSKTPIFIDANSEMIRIDMAACAYAEITTFKFPDIKSPTTSGVNTDEMTQYTKYQNELDVYLNTMISSGQMTKEYASQVRTFKLQEAWNVIQNAAVERMNRMTNSYQAAQLQRNSIQSTSSNSISMGSMGSLNTYSRSQSSHTLQVEATEQKTAVQQLESNLPQMSIVKLDSNVL